MIYIFIICIILLLIFCIFSQLQTKKKVPLEESFENKLNGKELITEEEAEDAEDAEVEATETPAKQVS